MALTMPDNAAEATVESQPAPPAEVVLANGRRVDLSTLQADELETLQWENERVFARRIVEAPKGSRQRAEALRSAYDTVNQIVATRIAALAETPSSEPVALGMHPRYGRLVVELLSRRQARGLSTSFFEIGYCTGTLLEQVGRSGFPVAGIEVSAAMADQAQELLGPAHGRDLLVGDFLSHDFTESHERYGVVYWSDVFEHVPPDEAGDFLDKIHGLLVPGGQLVTITPNWHMRPQDITGDVCPPRTEAAGLHLKEYTLREMTALLRRAGFVRVAAPLFIMPRRCVLWGNGLAGVKRLLEPCLELLPFRLASLLCRGLALSYTIATKAG